MSVAPTLAMSAFSGGLLASSLPGAALPASRARSLLPQNGRQRRTYFSGPKNLPRCGLHFVPHNHVWMVERLGKLQRMQEPGVTFIIPFLEKVRHVRGLAESTIVVSPQHTVTKDNVQVTLDGVVYYKVTDAHKSCYNITNPHDAISTMAQAIMRKQVGSMDLDSLFHNRTSLNMAIEGNLADMEADWGIKVMRYEVQDINVDRSTSNAMQSQSAAERQKRADILSSEGKREAVINQAQGKKQEKVMLAQAEAEQTALMASANKDRLVKEAEAAAQQVILDGQARAEVTRALAEAEADAIRKVAEAIGADKGTEAVAANMAKTYLNQLPTVFGNANTMVVPSDPLDVSAIIAKAMTIAKGSGSTLKVD